jgi:rfaE bifunctional protein kinase chain/domain
MNRARFQSITESYSRLRLAVVGDFCLDRYLEIDPTRAEVSVETGLPVHNVLRVRAQPGGAGTILNNLSALGIGTIYPVGFGGQDGEGFELWQALEGQRGVKLAYFVRTDQRRTFTYCKPLVVGSNGPPVELNRFDFKNWTPTPDALQEALIERVRKVADSVDAIIVLDQVEVVETGVVTRKVLEAIKAIQEQKPGLLIVADSRRGLRDYPPLVFKMNATELAALNQGKAGLELGDIGKAATALARQNGRSVFVTLSERGMLGVSAQRVDYVPALPVRGEIDIVGAGDAVTANLTAALAAGGTVREVLQLANAAASVVIHKLGTTGSASVSEIARLLRLPGG